MTRLTLVGTTLVVSLLILLAFPRTAHAYLDPGTGSYVLQLVIAGFVGVLFAIKIFWKTIVAFSRRLFSRKTSDAPDED